MAGNSGEHNEQKNSILVDHNIPWEIIHFRIVARQDRDSPQLPDVLSARHIPGAQFPPS